MGWVNVVLSVGVGECWSVSVGVGWGGVGEFWGG